MYKILIDFGQLQFDPLWIALAISSLLLLAVGQSYVSAIKASVKKALLIMVSILAIGDFIVYYTFILNFREQYPADYMFPHVSIYSFGFMLMIAFVVGTIFLIFQGKKQKPPIDADTILDLLVFIIVGSIIGARMIYILTQWEQYSDNPALMMKITEGGLSIHGGIFGAMLFGAIYVKAKKLSYWMIVDFFIVAVPLGMFFGRIGCFLNGCCYGIECEQGFSLGVLFPDQATWLARDLSPDLAALYDAGLAADGQYPRHPAQLYEAVGALGIFFYLLNFRHNKVFQGHVFLMFVFLYSILRFIVELYRHGDPETGRGSAIVLWDLITVAQVASIVLGLFSLIIMQDLKRRAALSSLMMPGDETYAEEKSEPEEEEEEEYEEEEPEEEEVEEEITDDDESSDSDESDEPEV